MAEDTVHLLKMNAPRTFHSTCGLLLVFVLFAGVLACADEPGTTSLPLIGYTELQTDRAGGRHANARTMRAVLIDANGANRTLIAEHLVNEPDAWTQFAGWSPDGKQAIILRGWEDPENARWEEEHQTFRFEPGKWLLDIYLVDVKRGLSHNVSSVDRVSHYNAGLFFISSTTTDNGKKLVGKLGFTAIIDGVSKPFVMDLDGHNKRQVSEKDAGFTYGYSASPDGQLISYHENYQVFIANADGSQKRHVNTGNSFDFAPTWSPDGDWLLLVSGEHYDCHPYIVRRDGRDLRKLADRSGYRGVTEFLDVFDFPGGSSDLPVWSVDGKSVFYTGNVGENVELFQVSLTGEVKQITHSAPGTSHYHPAPAPDGTQLLVGTKRNGVRQLVLISLADFSERQLTQLEFGRAAMWPHWQPQSK